MNAVNECITHAVYVINMLLHIYKECICYSYAIKTVSYHAYFGFLLLHPQDSRGDLQGGQSLGEVARRGGDVSDHGGPAVHVAQRLPQKHGQLAVPVIRKKNKICLPS